MILPASSAPSKPPVGPPAFKLARQHGIRAPQRLTSERRRELLELLADLAETARKDERFAEALRQLVALILGGKGAAK